MSFSSAPHELPLDIQALEVYAQGLDVAERALLAQHYVAVEAWPMVLALCRTGTEGGERGLALCEARALFALGERAAALRLLDGLLDVQSRDPLAAFYRAQLLGRAGQTVAAILALGELIELTPDFPGALGALAQLCLPGPPYREVLRRVHDCLRPKTYLEIGVEHGHTLQLAGHSECVIGIDPMPRGSPNRLPKDTRLFDQTSDSFFAEHDREALLGERRVDLAFIDGMHWFDFVLRDFANVEAWCHRRSIVILHDCLPVARVAALRERRTSFWVGDCWKAVSHLRRTRADLAISIIPCYPSGLVLIQNVDPGRPPAAEAPLDANFAPEPFPDEAGRWPWSRAFIENTDQSLATWLPSLRAAPGAASAPLDHR
jgi:hypothetical protein